MKELRAILRAQCKSAKDCVFNIYEEIFLAFSELKFAFRCKIITNLVFRGFVISFFAVEIQRNS